MTDLSPAREPLRDVNAAFRDDVLRGLSRTPREIPFKYLYDRWGSRLFDRITTLHAYYPARVETRILEVCADELLSAFDQGLVLVELGNGVSRKTRILLDRAPGVLTYVPVDISWATLADSARELARLYPDLHVTPVCADYTGPLDLPVPRGRPCLVFFPGSSIGNLDPPEVIALLRECRRVMGSGGAMVVGVDLKKDPALLDAAYDDPEGFTAAFNLNLLRRINRELGADFPLDRFRHHAFYDPKAGRVEMHLASLADQEVRVAGRRFRFRRGDTIWTERSYKYHPEEFAELARAAGLAVQRYWTDPERLFSVQLLVPGPTPD